MNPSLGGAPVFGIACHVVHIPHPVAVQKDAYVGQPGMTALYGGSRGRAFEITGVLVGANLPGVIAAEGALLAYADGIARTFIDTQGRAWPNVIFEGEYSPSPAGPKITDFGWCLPYRCVLHGLT
jgi:hypothetical protein